MLLLLLTSGRSSYQTLHSVDDSFWRDGDSRLNHNLPFDDLSISRWVHTFLLFEIVYDQTREHHHPVSLLRKYQVDEVGNVPCSLLLHDMFFV